MYSFPEFYLISLLSFCVFFRRRRIAWNSHDTNLFKSNYNYSFEPQILNREKKKTKNMLLRNWLDKKTNAKNQEDKIPTTFIEAKQEDYFYLFKDISSFDFDLVQGLRSTSH